MNHGLCVVYYLRSVIVESNLSYWIDIFLDGKFKHYIKFLVSFNKVFSLFVLSLEKSEYDVGDQCEILWDMNLHCTRI